MNTQLNQQKKYSYDLKKNYIFKRNPAFSSGIEAISIDCKKQVLFMDLQLMLQNKHLPARMWNDQIQEQISQKIIEIQMRVNGTFQLKDLYFSDVKQQKLEVIQLETQNLNKNQVLEELNLFGKSIISMNSEQNDSQGQYTLEAILKSAIDFYSKLKFKNFYSDSSIDDQLKLRYIIEQILLNQALPEIENNKNYILFFEDEDNSSKIIQNYMSLLSVQNKKIGQFVLTQVFGNNLNQIKQQYDFLLKLKEKSDLNYFSEKIHLLMNNFQEFKEWGIQWIFKTQLNCSQNHLQSLKDIFVLLKEDNCLEKYLNCKNEDIFKFYQDLQGLLNKDGSQKNTIIASYTQQDLKNEIQRSLDIICQKRNISEIDLDALDRNNVIEEISKKQGSILMQNVQLIGYLDFTRDLESYVLVERFFLNQIFLSYGNQFKKFYIDQLTKQISAQDLNYLELTISEQTLKIQQYGKTLLQALIEIQQCLQDLPDNQIYQDPLFKNSCLENYPDNLKVYFVGFYKKKGNYQANKFPQFVEQQSQQFSQKLNLFTQKLEDYLNDVSQKLLSEFWEYPLIHQYQNLTQKWIQTFKRTLLNQFIPFINMIEFIKQNKFTSLCQNEISKQRGKYQYLNQRYLAYQAFIQGSLEQYKQVLEIDNDEEQIWSDFKNNLLEQQKKKILEQEINNNKTNQDSLISGKEKDEIILYIKDFQTDLIGKSILTKIENLRNKKSELFKQQKQIFDTYYLPFECLENQIRDIIWHKPENELQKYLEKLRDFSQKIEGQVEIKCKKFQRLFNFELTQKKKQDLELFIKERVIEEFIDLRIEDKTKDQLVNFIGQKIEYFYGFSEEQINTKIQEKQDYFLNQYLREIYEITDQQCKEILIPDIPLDKLEIDKLQEYRPQFIIIVEESQNQQDLERRTFQYFQKQALSFVLENYQNQIEKRLKEINDPD